MTHLYEVPLRSVRYCLFSCLAIVIKSRYWVKRRNGGSTKELLSSTMAEKRILRSLHTFRSIAEPPLFLTYNYNNSQPTIPRCNCLVSTLLLLLLQYVSPGITYSYCCYTHTHTHTHTHKTKLRKIISYKLHPNS